MKFNADWLVRTFRDEAGDDGDKGGGGTQTFADMMKGLPDEMGAHASLTKFETLEGLAKSYVAAEKMIGKDKIVMPTTPEEFQAAYARLGRPEEATGYSYDNVKAVEGIELSDDYKTAVNTAMHAAGLNQSQAEVMLNAMNDWNGTLMGNATNADAQALSEAQDGLKTEWGDKFEANNTIAERAAGELGDEAMADMLDSVKYQGVPLGDHPVMLKYFKNLGEKMMEAGDLKGGGDGNVGESPEELQSQITELMASPSYQNAQAVDHKSVVNQIQALYKKLHAPKVAA